MGIGTDNEGFEKIQDEARKVHHAKNEVYGGAWRSGGIPILTDQVLRKINKFLAVQKGIEEGEELRDTLIDLSNYALMLLQMLDEIGEKKFHHCPLCGKLVE